MSSLLHAQDAFDPGDDFVGGGVGGFVQVDHSVGEMFSDGAGEGGGSGWDGCVVGGTDVEVGVVTEEEGPFGCVDFGCV